MGKKAAPPPDYRSAAEATAAGNLRNLREQTRANRPTQYTPWGTSEWTELPGGRWEQRLTLSPDEQTALDSQMRLEALRSGTAEGMYGRVAGELGSPPDFSGVTPWATVPAPGGSNLPARGAMPGVFDPSGLPDYGAAPTQTDFDAFNPYATVPGVSGMVDVQGNLSNEGLVGLDPSQRYYDAAGDAVYGQFERRMEPRFERAAAELDTRLRNQGLRPGDEAYDYQIQQLRQGQEDARLGAAYEATRTAGAEASRMLGMDSATRAQLFGERGTMGDFANRAAAQQYGMMADQFGQGMSRAEMLDRQRAQQAAEGGQRFQEGLLSGGFTDQQRAQRAAEQAQTYGQGMGVAGLADTQRAAAVAEDVQRYNQELASAGFSNQQRAAQIAEMLQQRGWSLNEINALLTNQMINMPQMPQFNNAGYVPGADYSGAARDQYAADIEYANMKNQSSLGSILGGLGAAALGAGQLGWKPFG